MKPRVSAAVVAAVSANVSTRVAKRLDANPRLAAEWTWSADGCSVHTTGDEQILLSPVDGVVRAPEQICCSCLLSPQCLHVLAVVTALEVEKAPTLAPAPAEQPSADRPTPALRAEQRAAAEYAARTGAQFIDVGAAAAGVVLQGELLRAVHACQLAGLHRLASCGLRLVDGVRALWEGRADFESAALVRAASEWMAVSLSLSEPSTPTDVDALVGVARRSFETTGHLTLTGIFTEPVIAGSGFSGVVTTFVNERGALFTLHDVQPGDANRVRAAYEAGARLGGGALRHVDLCRGRLLIEGATVSLDGRLGAGSRVKAVLAGRAGWRSPSVRALFLAPLAEQVARAFGAEAPGSTLLFVEAAVVGRAGPGLVLRCDGAGGAKHVVLALPAAQHGVVAAVDNLAFLARMPGLRARFVLRLDQTRRGTTELLALGPLEEEQPAGAKHLVLPESWEGVVNLGLDRLQGAAGVGLDSQPCELRDTAPRAADPLAPLRRRLNRLVLGGRVTLAGPALGQAAHEARALSERQLMPEGGRVLEALAVAAQHGVDASAAAARLGAAFARAAVYLDCAGRMLEQAAWLG